MNLGAEYRARAGVINKVGSMTATFNGRAMLCGCAGCFPSGGFAGSAMSRRRFLAGGAAAAFGADACVGTTGTEIFGPIPSSSITSSGSLPLPNSDQKLLQASEKLPKPDLARGEFWAVMPKF